MAVAASINALYLSILGRAADAPTLASDGSSTTVKLGGGETIVLFLNTPNQLYPGNLLNYE